MNLKCQPYLEIVKISAPIAGIQLVQVALISTDLMMMGFLGVHAIAAGGLAILLYNQLRTMCVGMVTNVGNLISESVGRGEKRAGAGHSDAAERDEIRDLLLASMLLATLVALGAGLVLIGISHALVLLQQDEEVVVLVQPFILALAPGLLPMLWLNVLRQFAVGMHRAGPLFQVGVISIGVNALLDALLVFGGLGIPRLGLVGIALSTTLVQVWTFWAYLRIVKRDREMRPLITFNIWKMKPEKMLKVARKGTPIALTYGSEAAITSVATLFMGAFGPVMLAASNIVNHLAYIVYQVNIGLSHGSSVLVSRALGREQYDRVEGIAGRALVISFFVMMLVALMYLLFPDLVLRPFLMDERDPAVMTVATTLLMFAIAHQFLKGSQNICIGLLRGLGNTRSGFTSSLIGYWLMGIPAMAIGGYGMGWGGYGVWFGLCLGFGVTSLLLWWCFWRELRMTGLPSSTQEY